MDGEDTTEGMSGMVETAESQRERSSLADEDAETAILQKEVLGS